MNDYPSTPDPQPSPVQQVQVSVPNVRPYVTYGLLVITILFYLLQLGGRYLLNLDIVTYLGIKVNDLIRQGEVWRLLSPVFLHGSILHIGFNMYALYVYGRGLEARFGHVRFTLLYFLSALAGNVLSFVLTPNPSLGASTAVFGLIAAEGAFLMQNRQVFGNRVNRSLMNLLYVAGINLFIGFTTSGVDNFGHIGGILGGLIFTWFGGPRWKVEGISPYYHLVDERQGHGAITGTVLVLLLIIPIAIMGWIWPR